jgi:SAM-dependent methyltransferase
MSAYDPAAYGDRIGLDYDTLYPADGLETGHTVKFLAGLAAEHPQPSLLEFGIGTGRLAIELHRRGIRVAGVDASEQMVAALRRKAPDTDIDVAIGDYVCTRVAGSFSVVALVFNNVLDSRGLPAQLALFENAARHLVPGGAFVVEAYVLPDEARNGQWTVAPRYVGRDHVELQMARFDAQSGTVERTLVHLRPEGAQFVSVRDVYSGPSELDVLARASRFEPVARYSSWDRAPFTPQSRRHISVYRRC